MKGFVCVTGCHPHCKSSCHKGGFESKVQFCESLKSKIHEKVIRS